MSSTGANISLNIADYIYTYVSVRHATRVVCECVPGWRSMTDARPAVLIGSDRSLTQSTNQSHIIIIVTRRQLRSVATTLHDDRDPVPSSTPV